MASHSKLIKEKLPELIPRRAVILTPKDDLKYPIDPDYIFPEGEELSDHPVCLEGEVFKAIQGNPDYWASNRNRIASAKRKKLGMKIMKPTLKSTGYMNISMLDENNKVCTYRFHIIIAKTWLPNPRHLPVVNHIDGDKTNNNLDNLEWTTYRNNSIHSTRVLGHKPPITKRVLKPVMQFTLKGKFVAKYESSWDASEKTGLWRSNITSVCGNMKYKATCGGFVWIYEKDYDPNKNYAVRQNGNGKFIAQYTLKGKYIRTFGSLKEASLSINRGIKCSAITAACSGKIASYDGFIWKYPVKVIAKDPYSEWKIHPNFPKYRISKKGEIYSLFRRKILKPGYSNGYKNHMLVTLDGTRKTILVHRLVAELYSNAGKDTAENLVVNHIDGDKNNNDEGNLEWTTTSKNSTHAYETGLNKNAHAVIQLDAKTSKHIAKYYSMAAGAKAVGLKFSTSISDAIKKGSIAGGYRWKYA